MSKRLKRKIRDICQLDHLPKEERRLAATKILNDTNAKQKLCNSCPGLSFRDIERAMRDILSERQPTEDELEELAVPEKFDPMPLPGNKATKMKYKILTQQEAQALVDASEAPFTTTFVSEHAPIAYPTYTLEETMALIEGDYNPNIFRRSVLKRKR